MASMAATSAPQRGQYNRPRGQHQGPRRGRGGSSRPHTQRIDRVASTSKAGDAAPQTSPGVGADDDVDEQGPSKATTEAEADIPIFERTSLVLASNPLPPLSSLGATLARFTNLHRLDMSDMQPGQADEDDDDDQDAGSSSRRLHSLSFLRDAQREAEKEVRRARKARRKEGKARQADEDDEERKTLAQSLTWFNLSSNPTLGDIQEKRSASSSSEDVLAPLSSLASLRVLNLSSCSLLTPPPRSALLPLSESLCALVLSHNRLTTKALAEALPAMPNLNTLVLSHNRLTALPKALPGLLPKLAKLSVSHNDLGAGEEEAEEADSDDDVSGDDEDEDKAKGSTASNPLPDFTMNTSLREVRLSHNPRLRVLPTHIASWGRGAAVGADEVDDAPAAEGSDGAKPRPRKHVRGLELLDVGHCGLSWETVQDALVSSVAPAGGMKNLTLAGNADVEDEDDYKSAIRRALPGLVVLDGQRVVERGRKKEAAAAAAEQVAEDEDAKVVDGGSSAAVGEATGQERPDKKRKRGSRGGSSAKGAAEEEDVAADVASDDEAEGSSKTRKSKKASKSQSSDDSQPEPPKLTAPRSGKRAKRGGKEKKQAKERGEDETGDKEDEDWLAHTRAKAVAAAQGDEEDNDAEVGAGDGPSKRKKAKKEGKDKDARAAKEAKAAEKKKKDKKDAAPRRAWDEVTPSAAADGAATELVGTPAGKTAPSASTAVAGVVEVKKKQAQRHQQQADKPATLGSGSGWLGGASGEGTGLGDGWGTGQSAWD